jgi:thioredoxin 1
MESARLQPKSTSGVDATMINETLEHAREAPLRPSVPDKIQSVTSSTFTRLVLEAEGRIAVEFMSYGCAHCRAIEPVLEQVAEMVKPQENIFRVNIAVEQELAGSYQIQGTPTLIMFLDGNEVGRVEGPSPTVSGVLTAVTQPFESRTENN